MALALRRDRAQRSGRGAASADLTLDLVRKIQKWKSKAVRTLEKKREARAMSVMKRNAERMVELEDFWLNVTLEELMAWSLRELRVALASRDLDQIGTRAQLIDRILQQQRRDLKRVARAEALEKLQRERRGEAKGTVIAFGVGYGPEQHCWDRLFVRGSPSVMQALCGRGVVQVTCSFDARVAACLTESGDVVSFGGCTPDQQAPLGYPDSKSRRARGNRREELFVSGHGRGLQGAAASGAVGGLPALPGESESDEDDAAAGRVSFQPAPAGAGPGGEPGQSEFGVGLSLRTDVDEAVPEELQPRQPLPQGPLSSSFAGAQRWAHAEPASATAEAESEGAWSDGEDGGARSLVSGLRHPRGASAAGAGPGELPGSMAGAGGTRVSGGGRDHGRASAAAARPHGGGEWAGHTAGHVPFAEHRERGRRPSMAGPAGLEPLDSSDDDSVGKMMVHEATKPPEGGSAPALPLQPMFERVASKAGEGNYPAGAQAPLRRVPVRRVVDPREGPGLEAAKAATKADRRAEREAEKKKRAEASEGMGLGALTKLVASRYGGGPEAEEDPAAAAAQSGFDDLSGLDAKAQLDISKKRLGEMQENARAKGERQRERKRQAAKARRRARRRERAEVKALEAGDPDVDGEDAAGGGAGADDEADSSESSGLDESGNPAAGRVAKAMGPEAAARAEARREERRRRRAVDRVGWTDPKEHAEALAARGAVEPPGANDRSGVRATAAGSRSRAVILAAGGGGYGEGGSGDEDSGLDDGSGAGGGVGGSRSGGSRSGLQTAVSLPRIGHGRASSRSLGAASAETAPASGAATRGSGPRKGSGASRLAKAPGGGIPGGPTGPRDVSIPWLTKKDRRRWRQRGEGAVVGDAAGAARRGAAERKVRTALGEAATREAARAEAAGRRDAWEELPGKARDAAVESELIRRGIIQPDKSAPPTMEDDVGGGSYGAGGGALVPTKMGTRERLFALGTAAARGGAAGGKVRLLPLSGQPLAEPEGEGISRVVTPRTALKHSLLLRRFGPVGDEGEFTRDELRKMAKGGHRPAQTGAGAEGGAGADKSKLGPGGSGAGFALVRQLPQGLEVDPDDPHWAEYDAKTREPWWEMSVGGLSRAKLDGVLAKPAGGASGADAAAAGGGGGGKGVRFAPGTGGGSGRGGAGWSGPADWEFNAAEFGGQRNYRDIERAVDADMRGYSEWAPPTEVRGLRGECVLQVGVSKNHGLAVTSGGDVFVWGGNPAGQHGMGASGEFKAYPTLVDSREHLGLPAGGRIVSASVGPLHSALVTDQGELLVAGSSAMGRLGLGGVRAHGPPLHRSTMQRRVGATPWGGGNLSGLSHTPEGRAAAAGTDMLTPAHVTVPVPVPFFSIAAAAAAGKLAHRRRVLRVSCGAAHTVALTDNGVYSWGSGAGGRLGIGRPRKAEEAEARSATMTRGGAAGGAPPVLPSALDRPLPTLVKALAGEVVLDVSAAAYHTLFLVQVPPLHEGGWVYACGTGTVGQLGLLDASTAWEPRLVESLLERDVVAVEVSAGAFHCAVLSTEGEVWTWGSAAGNCLGRPAQLSAAGYPAYTPLPGRAEGLREFGVGPAISVACGDRCTFVVTAPYNPRAWPDWKQEEMEAIDAARERRSAMMQQLEQADAEDRYKLAMERARLEQQRIHQLNRTRPLCVLAPPLPPGAAPAAKSGRSVLDLVRGKPSGRTGSEMDRDAEERADRGMPAPGDTSVSGRSGQDGQEACTGFIPRLFAQEVCDVCGHHRRHHSLLRRVPPVEELVTSFLQEIQLQEEDAAAAAYESSRRGGRTGRSSARSSAMSGSRQ
ncbi:hypothetical protein FNF27_02605 [Cafeteria roenbergensis]|uniref:SAP domain-containing protein n=4 Tax=Cafeteria roenbergensis TaxID=33653 RepID=A0A5A8EF61_CAFRO|nr:hypothetical protein FNF27_02605 [Cafeteria roenbergensis]